MYTIFYTFTQYKFQNQYLSHFGGSFQHLAKWLLADSLRSPGALMKCWSIFSKKKYLKSIQLFS
jgi:hypothetical protein